MAQPAQGFDRLDQPFVIPPMLHNAWISVLQSVPTAAGTTTGYPSWPVALNPASKVLARRGESSHHAGEEVPK